MACSRSCAASWKKVNQNWSLLPERTLWSELGVSPPGSPRERAPGTRFDSRGGPETLRADDKHTYRLKEGVAYPKLFTRAGFDVRDELETAQARILALKPSLLSDAVVESFARHRVTRVSASLPAEHESDEALSGARLGLYGAYPPDLNSWERPFAELLDGDTSGIVRWWHRKPVRKPWSITLPVPGHDFFYPDLAVGVEGRDTPGEASRRWCGAHALLRREG